MNINQLIAEIRESIVEFEKTNDTVVSEIEINGPWYGNRCGSSFDIAVKVVSFSSNKDNS